MEDIWKKTADYLADCLENTPTDPHMHAAAQASGVTIHPQLYKPCKVYTALGDADDGEAIPLSQQEIDDAIQLLRSAVNTYTSGAEMMREAQKLKQYAIGADRAARCISLWDCWRMLTAISAASGGETGQKSMLLCALDFSGIQSYIYTISSSKDTEKSTLDILRSRSTALGILMEEIVQEFMDSVGLDDVNIIYSGGGDAYVLLPNREDVAQSIASAVAHVNQWLIQQTGIALYLAYGTVACAPTDFSDPVAYRGLFRELTEHIAHSKLNRYTPEQLLQLNAKHGEYHECRICHRPATEGTRFCSTCAELIEFSSRLTGNRCRVSVKSEKPETGAYLTIPSISGGNRYVVPDEQGVRSYGGLFAFGPKTLKGLANAATGIERIGVLRADVDNLGQTFISGFASLAQSGQVNLLLMTSILSRELTLYFSERLDKIFSKNTGKTYIQLPGAFSRPDQKRLVTAIYAGGDDVFLIGTWNELLCAACDLAIDFREYTGKKLSLSAGIGMYRAEYPVFGFANETGEMESAAKEIPDGTKNALALFEAENVMHWEDFRKQVIEKMRVIHEYFRNQKSEDKEGAGNSFLFNLKTLIDELMENPEKKIDLARFAYLLARMEAKISKNASKEEAKQARKRYKELREKLYQWVLDPDNSGQRKYLQTAVNLYLYLKRERKGRRENGKTGKYTSNRIEKS